MLPNEKAAVEGFGSADGCPKLKAGVLEAVCDELAPKVDELAPKEKAGAAAVDAVLCWPKLKAGAA